MGNAGFVTNSHITLALYLPAIPDLEANSWCSCHGKTDNSFAGMYGVCERVDKAIVVDRAE